LCVDQNLSTQQVADARAPTSRERGALGPPDRRSEQASERRGKKKEMMTKKKKKNGFSKLTVQPSVCLSLYVCVCV
jgi:hypothetical protein